MIHMKPVGDRNDHFLLSSDEPVRVEVTCIGSMLAFVYQGAESDPESAPIGAFDTAAHNQGWAVGTPSGGPMQEEWQGIYQSVSSERTLTFRGRSREDVERQGNGYRLVQMRRREVSPWAITAVGEAGQ